MIRPRSFSSISPRNDCKRHSRTPTEGTTTKCTCSSSEWVTLNVGGRMFTTTRSEIKTCRKFIDSCIFNFFFKCDSLKKILSRIYLYIKIAAISFLYNLSVLSIELLKFENCPRFQIYKILFKDTSVIYRNS